MPRARWRCWRVLAIAALIAGAGSVRAELETEIEEGIGNWMAQAFIAQRGRLDQPPIEEWITGLGHDLLQHSPRGDLDYHFIVLDSPEANGFALPGGWVFITAGMLESMESEDELAAVMAHELGHLANRDFQRVLLRTALWLGLAEVLRNNERDDWMPLVQGAQLVETLHHSRERESQADLAGARIAWQAGYDFRAMAAFLNDEPKWSYLQTVFSTHPHPAKRTEWMNARFAELRTEDPEGLLALARSLIERGRCARAAEVLDAPLPIPHESERAELLARVNERARPAGSAPDGVGLQAGRVTAVSEAAAAAVTARKDATKPRDLAWKRLRRLWNDGQVERGLVVAQAVDPELNDAGYLLLVAQSVNALHRAMRGANLVARTLHMRAANGQGLESLANQLPAARISAERATVLGALADEVADLARQRSGSSLTDTEELARLAGDYHECARLVAPLLIELALAGDGDPAGRLTFARFMLIETRVRMLDARLGHLDDVADRVAADAWLTNVCVNRLRLNLAALQADETAREALFAGLARRVGGEPDALAVAWDDGIMPGDRALEILRERLHTRGDTFGEDLRATQILIRIASIEVKEQVSWCAKEKSASEGAGTLALRSAVRHPQ